MTSDARVKANRANARLSTGPRTEAGKVRSSQNSTKHGFTARQITILPGEQSIFDDMLDQYTAELRPEGILELDFFRQLVRASWDMRRASILEAALVTSDTDPLADPNRCKEAERYARYYHRAQRLYASSLRRLRELQDLRAARLQLAESTQRNLPPLTDPLRSAKRSQYCDQAWAVKAIREIETETALLYHKSLIHSMRQNEPKPAPKTPRNSQCPCGSGKKFKRCCGFNAPPVLGAAA
jgi:hypothetical protein